MIKIQLCGAEDPQPPNMDILKSSLPLVVKYTELRRVGCLFDLRVPQFYNCSWPEDRCE